MAFIVKSLVWAIYCLRPSIFIPIRPANHSHSITHNSFKIPNRSCRRVSKNCTGLSSINSGIFNETKRQMNVLDSNGILTDLSIQFSQDAHYFLEGSEKLDCVEGEWEGEAPTCTVHTCDTFLCEETEYCEDQDSIPTCLPRENEWL